MSYLLPYHITNTIIHFIAEISELVGRITIESESPISPHLRKNNKIRTIHSSLAIENNSLSLEQMTDIIDGKRVFGTPHEICEVKNAFETYNHLFSFDPFQMNDLLRAHRMLMSELTDELGQFRSGGVGVFAGSEIVHIAPPAHLVHEHIRNLLDWVKNAEEHPLIKSCVFHYEFEFIHPFADGNGRMGRMWQTLLLSHWKPVFQWLPVESIIHERQLEYYKVLNASDRLADSTVFIEFMLTIIRDVLHDLIQTDQVTDQVTEQVQRLLYVLGNETLSAKELLERLELKHRPTFMKTYVRPALELGLLEMTVPDKPRSNKQKYRAIKKMMHSVFVFFGRYLQGIDNM